MPASCSVTADGPTDDNRPDVAEYFDWGGFVSFLTAGAVLFASLIIGSSVSLVLAGGNDLIAAILEGFLELGLWTFGGFFVAFTVAVAAGRRRL